MTGVGILSVNRSRLGIGPWRSQFQAQLTPEATHRLLVDSPAFAIQECPDPPISESRMDAGEFLDPPGQRHFFVTDDARVPQAGPCQIQRAGDTTLRYAVMLTQLGSDESSSFGSHGFFFKAS